MAWIKTNESRWNQNIDRAFRRSPSSRRSRQNSVGWWLETTKVKPLTLTWGQKLIKSFEKPRRQRNAFNIHLNAHITRLSSTSAALKSPLLYMAAVISPISTRNEGQLKTKVYSIILFVSLNAKWKFLFTFLLLDCLCHTFTLNPKRLSVAKKRGKLVST